MVYRLDPNLDKKCYFSNSSNSTNFTWTRFFPIASSRLVLGGYFLSDFWESNHSAARRYRLTSPRRGIRGVDRVPRGRRLTCRGSTFPKTDMPRVYLPISESDKVPIWPNRSKYQPGKVNGGRMFQVRQYSALGTFGLRYSSGIPLAADTSGKATIVQLVGTAWPRLGGESGEFIKFVKFGEFRVAEEYHPGSIAQPRSCLRF